MELKKLLFTYRELSTCVHKIERTAGDALNEYLVGHFNLLKNEDKVGCNLINQNRCPIISPPLPESLLNAQRFKFEKWQLETRGCCCWKYFKNEQTLLKENKHKFENNQSKK
jgi:hypothetical protein